MYIYVLSLKLTHSTHNRMRFIVNTLSISVFVDVALSFSFSLSVHIHVCCQTVYRINCVYFFFLLFFFVFVRFGTLLCANQSVLYVRCVCICMFHNDDVGLQFYELKRVRISNGPISFHSHSYIEFDIYIYTYAQTQNTLVHNQHMLSRAHIQVIMSMNVD